MVTTRTNLTKRRYVGRAGESVSIIGIHTMEAKELSQTAENIANYFLGVNASAHWCVDSDSRVRSVNDSDTAWTLPGANSRSINIEIAGYAKQTPDDWADAYSINALEVAALCAAETCVKYGIPVRKLNDAQIRNKEKGFVGHVDISRVYKKSSHWDPGPHFPWDYFLGRVNANIAALGGSVPSAPNSPAPQPKPTPTWDNKGYTTAYIMARQNQLRALGYQIDADGYRGAATIDATVDFQKKNGLDPDGIPGPATARKLDAALAVKAPGKPNCVALQQAVRTAGDNAWGANTDKHFDALREASNWGGNDFPYGKAFAQQVVGAVPDGIWGGRSADAHTATVINVQNALKAMGFDAGDSDGKWGNVTEAAYQAARNACHI